MPAGKWLKRLTSEFTAMFVAFVMVLSVTIAGIMGLYQFSLIGDAATPNLDEFKIVALGQWHTLGIRHDGSLWAWGSNSNGQLGLGDNEETWDLVPNPVFGPEAVRRVYYNQLNPVRVGTDTDWVNISVNAGTSFGIRENGTLWAWGLNQSGALGIGASHDDVSYRNTPVQVGTSTNWVYVSAGGRPGFGLAFGLRADGSLWGWGSPANALGIGATSGHARSPLRVGTDNDWAHVSVGDEHVLAVRKDGSLWAWGSNINGQLGIGDLGAQSRPFRVGTDYDWASISAGAHHSVGIRKDGSLWTWGRNAQGQLGLGFKGGGVERPSFASDFLLEVVYARFVPTRVGIHTDWTQVSAKRNQSFGIRACGTLWAWGSNLDGALGLGDSGAGSERVVPTRVGNDTDWVHIFAGRHDSFGIRGGKLFAWGENSHGQLGIGNIEIRLAPVSFSECSGQGTSEDDDSDLNPDHNPSPNQNPAIDFTVPIVIVSLIAFGAFVSLIAIFVIRRRANTLA
jgi:alpha-tubulin suppressor-like RCC1 family protein